MHTKPTSTSKLSPESQANIRAKQAQELDAICVGRPTRFLEFRNPTLKVDAFSSWLRHTVYPTSALDVRDAQQAEWDRFAAYEADLADELGIEQPPHALLYMIETYFLEGRIDVLAEVA